MITSFKQYNEGIKHLLVGPTKEELWSYYMNSTLKGIIKTIPTSPEDFFNQIMDGCVKIDDEIYGKKIGNLFNRRTVRLFINDLETKKLYISDKYIWSFFENIYELNYNEIQTIITNCLDGTKWSGLHKVKYIYTI